MRRARTASCGLLLAAAMAAHGLAQADDAAPAAPSAQSAQDKAAFAGVDPLIAQQMTDVQSVVVMMQGRVVYEYYRDGSPDTLRDVHSVSKSALSALVGIALAQGKLTSLDEPVVSIVPQWKGTNADPRADSITVRHLLTMTAGFAFEDPTGTASPGRPGEAWKRPLRVDPGTVFAYDNAAVNMLVAVLEKATGMRLADYARRNLTEPLGMAEPDYRRGLALRTSDMARLGQLYLQKGHWEGRQIVPEAYVLDSTRKQNGGGPPVSLSYGYMWWVVPSEAARPTFMASGYGGQAIWVYPPMDLVIATTSTATPETAARGQALKLIRTQLFAAARQRAASMSR